MSTINDDHREKEAPQQPAFQPQPVVENHVHIDNNRLFDIIATLLACGAVGGLAWAIAQSRLEVAASGATVFFFQLGRIAIANGLIPLPQSKIDPDAEIEAAKSTVATLWRGWKAWVARSPLWRVALIAAAWAVGFIILRQGLLMSLSVFSNPIVAGSVAAAFGAVVIAPGKIVEAIRKAKNRRGRA